MATISITIQNLIDELSAYAEFNSLSQAQQLQTIDNCIRIVFGKYIDKDSQYYNTDTLAGATGLNVDPFSSLSTISISAQNIIDEISTAEFTALTETQKLQVIDNNCRIIAKLYIDSGSSIYNADSLSGATGLALTMDASNVNITPISGFTATDVQGALEEIGIPKPKILLTAYATGSWGSGTTKNGTFDSPSVGSGLTSPNTALIVFTLPSGTWKLSNLFTGFIRSAGGNATVITTIRLSSEASPFGALSALTTTTTVTTGFSMVEDTTHTVNVTGGANGDRISFDIAVSGNTVTGLRIMMFAEKIA